MNIEKITRIEVFNTEYARCFSNNKVGKMKIDIQDNGRTLKIYIIEESEENYQEYRANFLKSIKNMRNINFKDFLNGKD